MAIATVTLLIANLVIVGSAAIYLGKEIGRTNKELAETESRLYTHISKTAEGLGYDVADIGTKIDEKLQMKEVKGEIKNHISKEFLAMAFRDIRIVNLNRRGAK
ncbi:MAG: hypothetical protein E7211_09760 [Clostridium lundense]|nr:hypothetical protein [Clostridium lundense]